MWFGFKERILICQSAVICRVADGLPLPGFQLAGS
jgi:hypothetical protein